MSQRWPHERDTTLEAEVVDASGGGLTISGPGVDWRDWANELPSAERSRSTDAACRALDIAASVLLLVVLSPLLLAIAIAIRIDSPGSPIFRQRRVGRDLRPFTVNKFRTMRSGAGDAPHRDYVLRLIADHRHRGAARPMLKLSGDQRVTRLGHFLRRSSLDELPQLWNVLRGEMSLVGPRPPIPYEVENYPLEWMARFVVKPGVTGLWQVSGRSERTLAEMIALDLEYTRRRSVRFNLEILLRTIPTVLNRRGAA